MPYLAFALKNLKLLSAIAIALLPITLIVLSFLRIFYSKLSDDQRRQLDDLCLNLTILLTAAVVAYIAVP